MFRNVIRIDAVDSPNVKDPGAKYPGLLTREEYEHRLRTWDEVKACVGLRGKHYRGAELLLFPPHWLDRAEELAASLALSGRVRKAKAIGCDPGEGGADTAWAVVDELGLLDLVSAKTPDTSVIPAITIDLMRKWGVEPENVALDRGGGGKQHADNLRSMGYEVTTVAFGESLTLPIKRGLQPIRARKELQEERSEYFNRRSEMYGETSKLLDPAREVLPNRKPSDPIGFAIPAKFTELRRQLAMIPKTYDNEGRLKLLPKNNPQNPSDPRTLTKLIGCSPDHADALVIATHVLLRQDRTVVVSLL